MFCPNCRAEYIDGITDCKECGVPLVTSIPAEPEMYKFVKLLSTFNLVDIAVIKSLLDDGEITYYFIGENFNQIDQLVQPARLFIREDQVEEARGLLKDLSITYLGLSSLSREEE
ncbi:MAG: DUF2007 domain-containing protein [Bacteroidota bacterium]